jgi:hypothetical protein
MNNELKKYSEEIIGTVDKLVSELAELACYSDCDDAGREATNSGPAATAALTAMPARSWDLSTAARLMLAGQ